MVGKISFEKKKNNGEVDNQIGVLFDQMMGKIVLKCKKNLTMTGGFRQVGSYGKGDGETSDGNNVEFEFYSTKNEAIAKLNDFKNDILIFDFLRFGRSTDINLIGDIC